MTRAQRARHVQIWAVLTVVLIAVFGAALIVRERVAEAMTGLQKIGAP